MLQQFDAARGYDKNQLLYSWLTDDAHRAELYAQMKAAQRTTLRFPSLAYPAGIQHPAAAYLVTAPSDIEHALKHLSVAPYAALGGGEFMLAMDRGRKHDTQRAYALRLLSAVAPCAAACAKLAFERASVLAFKRNDFDLAALAEGFALRYVSIIFGFPDQAYVVLKVTMARLYEELCFQILGRHFSGDPMTPRPFVQPKDKLERWIIDMLEVTGDGERRIRKQDAAVCAHPVLALMQKDSGGYTPKQLAVIVQGLIGGTIGNVQASVCIAMNEFFNRRVNGRPLLVDAREAAARGELDVVGNMMKDALMRNPPAAFLPRRSDGKSLRPNGEDSSFIPAGAELVLGIGAAEKFELVFGGAFNASGYAHQCVGQRVIWPALRHAVNCLLELPGLAQVMGSAGDGPRPLEKRWGMICRSYPMQHDRGRHLNQRCLSVIMRVKEPLAEHTMKLAAVIAAGAPAIEDALKASRHVHFAFFQLLAGGRQLGLFTVYDGDFDAYIEHFALKVELFDKLFEHIEEAPPLPVRSHPKEFIETIRRFDRQPVSDYFYSAYGKATASQIDHMLKREGLDV
jgi:hypothetical protein